METNNKSRKRRKRRNEYKMKMDLLEAVRGVLKDKGYIHLNIQSICEHANADRNAIYRHFKDFDNLLTKFLESRNYGIDSFKIEIDEPIKDYKLFLKEYLLSQYNLLNRNTELQQTLVWELAELSQRTKLMAIRRENEYIKLTQQNEKEFSESDIDINGIIALIIAGVYYLISHKKHSTFFKVDLVNEKERLPLIIEQLVEMVFEIKERKGQKLEFATNALKNGVDIETVCKIFDLAPEVVEKLQKK